MGKDFKQLLADASPTGKFLGASLHPAMSDSAYRALESVNQSHIKAVHQQGPLHAEHYEYVEREQTKAMLIGSLYHCMTLQPDLVQTQYAQAPANIDRRTTAGKAAYAEFEEFAQGKSIIPAQDWMIAEAMAFNSQAVLAESIKSASGKDEPEILNEVAFTAELLVEYDWDGNSHKFTFPVKGKLDCLVKFSESHWRIYDLKSMASLGDDEVVGAARGGCWNIQCAFYRDAIASLTRRKDMVVDFHYIACEKDLPNKAREYAVDELMFLRGRSNYLKSLVHEAQWQLSGRPTTYEAYAGVGNLNA